MIVSIKQIGGFAGTIDLGSVDTDNLNEEAARPLEKAVADVGFFDLPESFSSDVEGFDIPEYEISVSDGTREHQVRFREDGTLPKRCAG